MRLPGLLVAVIALAAAPTAGWTAQLDKQICVDLKAEHGWLQQKGATGDMAKGPEWAKANLPSERLKAIERLIHVEEQLAFRCPQPHKRHPPADDEEGTAAATPAKATGKAAKAAVKPSTGKDVAAPVPAKKAVKAAVAQDSSPSTPVKKAPKGKAKANDAYSPAANAQGSGAQ